MGVAWSMSVNNVYCPDDFSTPVVTAPALPK